MFELATFLVIVSLWSATIWLAYRIGMQSVKPPLPSTVEELKARYTAYGDARPWNRDLQKRRP